MSFFPEPPQDREPEPEKEWVQPAWMGAPDDVLAGVVPVEAVLGRSEVAVVALTGIRSYPTGLAMTLAVRARGSVGRRDLDAEVFDGPYQHDMGPAWQRDRLKWGFEFSDGRRATNVDDHAWSEQPEDGTFPDGRPWEPDRPVLIGGGGHSSRRSVDRAYWLWPLPPTGRLRVVCQWLEYGIELTEHDLDAEPFRAAAGRSQPMWPAN